MGLVRTKKPGAESLIEKACRECTLKVAPLPEVQRVIEWAVMPDAAMDYRVLPFWMVNGIGVYRTMNRGGF